MPLSATKTKAISQLFSVAMIATVALAVEIPFLHYGFPSGHDVEFHLYSWLDVARQWHEGILYPRWAALAHFAYGEPRFVFYPPASWTLGAILTTFFPWAAASCLYIWIVLTAAGCSMYLLARRWLNRNDAVFAACFYAVNPYHLLIVYWRSAFAELLASCLLPLLLLFILKMSEAAGRERWRYSAWLILILAAAWLVNAPAAVMIHYSFALLIVIVAWRQRSFSLLMLAAIVVAAAAALSAFYLLPAVYEQKWVHIAEAVSQGSRPQDNFLFIHTTDADHDGFNKIVSWLAAAEIFLTLAALAIAKRWRNEFKTSWLLLTGWSIATAALMFSPSRLLWDHLPKLQFMQFPWRWLLCLSMIFPLAITIALRKWWSRAVVSLAMLLLLTLAWTQVQTPWWDAAADLREMQDNVATGAGYEGTDEYTPIGADPTAIDKDARKVSVDGPEQAAIRVLAWNAEYRRFTVELSAPSNLAVRLFNYPAWRVEVNGQPIQPTAREGSGQMLLPLPAGPSLVEIRFAQTWDRKLGGWISFVAGIAMLVWIFLTYTWRHSETRRRSATLGARKE